jgi:C4-dicarboxylate-specific signal transduction histidine kinase
LRLARDTRPHAERLDVDALLAEVRSGWHGRLAAQGRALRVPSPSHAQAPQASTAAIRQMLTVLLDNATDHGAGTVTVAVRDVDGAVAIDVADEGSGRGRRCSRSCFPSSSDPAPAGAGGGLAGGQLSRPAGCSWVTF